MCRSRGSQTNIPPSNGTHLGHGRGIKPTTGISPTDSGGITSQPETWLGHDSSCMLCTGMVVILHKSKPAISTWILWVLPFSCFSKQDGFNQEILLPWGCLILFLPELIWLLKIEPVGSTKKSRKERLWGVFITLTKRREYHLRKSKARHLQSVAPLKAEKGQT